MDRRHDPRRGPPIPFHAHLSIAEPMHEPIQGVRVRTGDADFDTFFERIKAFLLQDRETLIIDGNTYRGYRSPDSRAIWIRDHSDMLRAARYFDEDLQSATHHFAETQAANGRIFDYFTIGPEHAGERENWVKYVRVPVESDVEYRFVKAVFLGWQATGDDQWMLDMLPAIERALNYALTHPWRWHQPWGVIKRPYTIDTWDFDYTAGRAPWLNFQITPDTYWGVMHGDNSGYYEAMMLTAQMCRSIGWTGKAQSWEERAEKLREAANRICWNGRFYTHFVPISKVSIPGVEPEQQLSLSNPMDINRGMADHAQAVSILREYQRRRETTEAFAEWFSIDPPFPDGIFGDEKLVAGAYVNGGIMPLVGGELARAAFEHGMETYGVQILRQYIDMINASGETYLWYFPDGRPASVETSTSPDAQPTDGWGSSAMLWAFVEGLCGVVDRSKLFEDVQIAPRWLAAGVHHAEVAVGYGCGRGIHYTFEYQPEHHRITFTAAAPDRMQLRLLLPENQKIKQTRLNGKAIKPAIETVETSRYCVIDARQEAQVEIVLAAL